MDEKIQLTTKFFTGSCLCGHIRYKTRLPGEQFEPYGLKLVSFKCNCTICQKPGFHSIRLPADAADGKEPAFFVESPKDLSSELLGVVRGPRAQAQHDSEGESADAPTRYFCKGCGVQVWMRGTVVIGPEDSPTGEQMLYKFFTVNLNTLDQPQEGLDVSESTVKYMDGLHDNFRAGMKDKPWSGGSI